MSSKIRLIGFALACLAALFPYHSAAADMGPKPSMEFTFEQEVAGEPLTILAGELYECDLPDCSDAHPLENVAVQGFDCYNDGSCEAVSYGFSQYHYLELEFSDGVTRRSNIFETSTFNGKYAVTIRENDLLVTARFTLDPLSGTTWLLLCGCCLLLLAMLTGSVILIVRRTKRG